MQWGVSLTKLNAPNEWQSSVLNAGTPVYEVLRYSGLDKQALRAEGRVLWNRGRMHIGGRFAIVAETRVLEAWLAWTLQETWPLHLTTGVETWRSKPFDLAECRLAFAFWTGAQTKHEFGHTYL